MHNIERACQCSMAGRAAWTWLRSMVRGVNLFAVGMVVALLVVGSTRPQPSCEACRAAPAIVVPAVLSVSAAPAASPPCPAAAPSPSCPEPAPIAAPPRPALSSPDGAHVVNRGFPALSADGKEVAMLIHGRAGEVELGIFLAQSDEYQEMIQLVDAAEPDPGSAMPAVAPAEPLAERLRRANDRVAGFTTMPGTELGLTRDEVLAMRDRATTLQVGELAVHHRGTIVSVRRIADPSDILLDWVAPELDTAGACAPFAAAAYTAGNVIALRFDHARCPGGGSVYHVFSLDAPSAPPGPVPDAPGEVRVDLETGDVHGLPALSPDGSTIAMDAPLLGGVEPSCVINLLRSSDGKQIGTIRTSPEDEYCGDHKPPSPARRAMLAGLAARLASWRTLAPVDVARAGDDMWLRRGPRLWQRSFTPIHQPPEPPGSDCSAPPHLTGVDGWYVGGSRVLFRAYYGTGGCMCDREAQQVERVPGYEGPAAAPRRK